MDTTEIERELDDFKKCLDYIEKAQSQKGGIMERMERSNVGKRD